VTCELHKYKIVDASLLCVTRDRRLKSKREVVPAVHQGMMPLAVVLM
jgi:hypothetical protein